MLTMHEVWMTEERKGYGKPHYPSFDVRHTLIGMASSVENAEKIIKEKRDGWTLGEIYCFHVVQKVVNRLNDDYDSLSLYVYDKDGRRIAGRVVVPDYKNPDTGTMLGHKPEEIQFREGDIVEVLQPYYGGSVRLGIIVREHLDLDGFRLKIDIPGRDCYYDIAYPSSEAPFFDHGVSMYALFKPQYKIHPALEEKLKRVYNDSLTYPMRRKIAKTTAKLQIEGILEELEIKGEACLPSDRGSYVTIILDLPSGPYHVDIPEDYVFNHIDRVRTTLFRLVGKPATGRGYNIKLQKGHEEDLPF